MPPARPASTLVLLVRHGVTPTTGRMLPGRSRGLHLSDDGRKQAEKLTEMLLAFAEKNPGMVRVMTGDALVGEHERLQTRVNQFFDRFEATLKQSLRIAEDGDAAGRAAAILRYAIGCMHQFGKSGFARKPSESFSAQRKFLLA